MGEHNIVEKQIFHGVHVLLLHITASFTLFTR